MTAKTYLAGQALAALIQVHRREIASGAIQIATGRGVDSLVDDACTLAEAMTKRLPSEGDESLVQVRTDLSLRPIIEELKGIRGELKAVHNAFPKVWA